MNVFEDLIEELKGENLIEDSIFDLDAAQKESASFETASEDVDGVSGPDQLGNTPENEHLLAPVEAPMSTDDKTAFYRKVAMDEVASLQMVGHVFSGVEREQMKSVAEVYDDLEAKKALHRFLQASPETDPDEFSSAQNDLLSETVAWNSALAIRDDNISVANLRRFCENSKPVLSSQALISMARYYRNAAYSELVRSKFEYVMTRLFSREIEDEKRKLLFGRIEMIGHINTFYANWMSLSVYSSAEYADAIKEHVSGFSAHASLAESAETLDDLLNSNVFDVVRQTKEQLADMFFAPEVTAAAIDCNLRIGNKFVELVWDERLSTEAVIIEEKYGPNYDQMVSTAAGRTLQLIEILRSAPEPEVLVERPYREPVTEHRVEKYETEDNSRSLFKVNKWLLAATFVVLALSIAVYFWAENYETTQTVKSVAAEVDVRGTSIEKYVRSSRKTAETLYCVTSAAWDEMDEKAQKEVLIQSLGIASEKGANKVHFVNIKGRTVGYAKDGQAQIYTY